MCGNTVCSCWLRELLILLLLCLGRRWCRQCFIFDIRRNNVFISSQSEFVNAESLATKSSPRSFLKQTVKAGFVTFWHLSSKRWKSISDNREQCLMIMMMTWLFKLKRSDNKARAVTSAIQVTMYSATQTTARMHVLNKQGVALTGRNITAVPPWLAAPWWFTLHMRVLQMPTEDIRRQATKDASDRY